MNAVWGEMGIAQQLTESPMSEGGFKEYFDGNVSEKLVIKSDHVRRATAIVLENAKRFCVKASGRKAKRHPKTGLLILDETTRSSHVGGFVDYLLPLIRASFPNNPILDLVSVQPTLRRTAQIIYWDLVAGRTKGRYARGAKLHSATSGWQPGADFNYTNNVINGEAMAATAASATYTATLTYNDGGGVIPGSVRVTFGAALVIRDDGRGNLVRISGTIATLTSGTINYATGAIAIVAGTAFSAGVIPVAVYKHDNEGSSTLPQLRAQITSAAVETERRVLQLIYSTEAAQDAEAEIGVDLNDALLRGASEHLNAEIAGQLLYEMWGVADVVSTFSLTVPAGITRAEHFSDLQHPFAIASNSINSRTQKGTGTWVVVDNAAASVLQSSNRFEGLQVGNTNGLHRIGTFGKQWAIYKFNGLAAFPGASSAGNLLMGYRGQEMTDAGMIYAPQHLLYGTPAVTLSDFLSQQGVASRYATKVVSSDMFSRISLT